MAADETTADSDLAVMDANEIKQKRRLTAILDAHDNVEERASKAYKLHIQGEISQHARNVLLQKAVQAYLREVYVLMKADHNPPDDPNPYWFPYLYVNEQDAWVPHPDAPGEPPIGVVEMDHEDDVLIKGLEDFMHADEIYTERWTESRRTRHSGRQVVEQERSHSIPERVIWEAYLWINQYLDEEHDLEIKFEQIGDELPTWGFEEIEDEDVTDTADLAREEMNGD